MPARGRCAVCATAHPRSRPSVLVLDCSVRTHDNRTDMRDDRSMLLELPEELLIHCALMLFMPSADMQSVQRLSWTCKSLRESSHSVRELAKDQLHSLRWAAKSTPEDVVIRSSGRGLRSAVDGNWRRAFGLPLRLHGRSTWDVRVDTTRAHQGLLQIGISLTHQGGVCEWSVSPFYGRLVRRQWDRDQNLLVRAAPPDSHPVRWQSRDRPTPNHPAVSGFS